MGALSKPALALNEHSTGLLYHISSLLQYISGWFAYLKERFSLDVPLADTNKNRCKQNFVTSG
jgi:hypothetical protein